VSLKKWHQVGHEGLNFNDIVQLHVAYSIAILCNSMRYVFSTKQFKGTCYVYI
jgi:hypothetical protein